MRCRYVLTLLFANQGTYSTILLSFTDVCYFVKIPAVLCRCIVYMFTRSHALFVLQTVGTIIGSFSTIHHSLRIIPL